jgi:hypothetical protein
MGMTITLAGVDITAYVEESSIDIHDTLGQGPGVGGGSSGRATQCTFLTRLGPAMSAVGAGTVISTPTLVRQGEVKIYDSTGTCIFGGYATGYDDQTYAKVNFTEVECHDYWQHLDRVVINKVYDGQTDVYIINDLLDTYATWVDKSILPTIATYTFGPENYQHFTLQKALQRVADKTGYAIWIDPNKKMHYVNPVQASTAPFQLSDNPDFSSSFAMGVNSVKVDDNSAINRVYFYGGKHLSTDFTQDLSVMVNGTNDIFTLSYYPHKAADGFYHLLVNGVDHHITGFSGGTTNADKLIRDGGTASYLLDIDAHVIYFNTAPTVGTTVQLKYRHEIPLVVVLTDENSHSYYGDYYDGVISDQSVFDTATAIKRCRTLLLEQSYGLTTLEVKCWKPGIQSGMILRIDHITRAVHNSYIVQEVHVVPKGGGFFEYVITLGAWNWNLVDIVTQLARNANPDDTSSSEEEVPITVESYTHSVGVTDTWTTSARTMGGYFFRDTPTGDGHDGYFGLASFA